jgi:hypothetical protein
MFSHKKAIMHIGWYLLDTSSHGIVYKPDTMKGLECYVDADLLVDGAKLMPTMLKMSSCIPNTYSPMPAAKFIGSVAYKQELLSVLLRQNS